MPVAILAELVDAPARGAFRAFVTGYLIDLALPFSLVLLLGVGLAPVPVLRQPVARALIVFCIGAVVEGSQYFGIPLFGRTFDPVDLLMYAAGATAALGFERLAFSSSARGPSDAG